MTSNASQRQSTTSDKWWPWLALPTISYIVEIIPYIVEGQSTTVWGDGASRWAILTENCHSD
jgi:hypothetical protein